MKTNFFVHAAEGRLVIIKCLILLPTNTNSTEKDTNFENKSTLRKKLPAKFSKIVIFFVVPNFFENRSFLQYSQLSLYDAFRQCETFVLRQRNSTMFYINFYREVFFQKPSFPKTLLHLN